MLPRPFSAGSRGPMTRSRRVSEETQPTMINTRRHSFSNDSRKQLESESEIEAINARSNVRERDHVNYDAGPQEQANHHSFQRLDTSLRLECNEHPPDLTGPRDGKSIAAAARTLHHDDRALGELHERNPIVNDHHPRDRSMLDQSRPEVGDSLYNAAEHSHRMLGDIHQGGRAMNELRGRLSS